MDPTSLQELALEVLDVATEALDTIPILAPGLEGAPERAFISPGRPALEGCGQLCVYVDSVFDADTNPGGLAAGRRNVMMKRNHVRLIVTIDRCVIDSRQGDQAYLQPYPASDLTATAEQTNADGWALWNHIYNAWRSERFLTVCTELFFEGLRALPEEGGRAGWTLTLRAILDGYQETPSSP